MPASYVYVIHYACLEDQKPFPRKDVSKTTPYGRKGAVIDHPPADVGLELWQPSVGLGVAAYEAILIINRNAADDGTRKTTRNLCVNTG